MKTKKWLTKHYHTLIYTEVNYYTLQVPVALGHWFNGMHTKSLLMWNMTNRQVKKWGIDHVTMVVKCVDVIG